MQTKHRYYNRDLTAPFIVIVLLGIIIGIGVDVYRERSKPISAQPIPKAATAPTWTEQQIELMHRDYNPTQLVSRGADREQTYIVTAYCSCVKCCGKSDGITKSGVKAVEGVTVAVDTAVITMGSKICIEGIGERIAQDTGKAIKGNRIDLYFDKHSEALQFGVKKLKVRC